MSYSENDLSYSEETIHTAHIITTYIWGMQKMLLFILWRQYILITLLEYTAVLFWKYS